MARNLNTEIWHRIAADLASICGRSAVVYQDSKIDSPMQYDYMTTSYFKRGQYSFLFLNRNFFSAVTQSLV